MSTFATGNTGMLPIKTSSSHDSLAVTRLGWGLFWEFFSLPAGVLLSFAGIICFFAFNWEAMPLFAKFSLLVGGILLTAAVALQRGFDTTGGGTALLLCALLAGPLMAVYGQAYQTGADAWELFVSWGGLLIIFALCARTAGLWFAAFALTSLALGLWIAQVGEPFLKNTHDEKFWFAVFIWWFAACLALWELAAWLRQKQEFFGNSPFLDSRWLPRTISVCLTSALTIAMVSSISGEFSYSENTTFYFLPEYVLCFAVGWVWFRKIQPDLMPIALGVFSLLAVIMTQASKILNTGNLQYSISLFLILAFLLLSLTVSAVYIIMRLKASMPADNEALPSRKKEYRKKLAALRAFMRNMSLLTFAGRPRRPDHDRPWYLQVLTGICLTIVITLFFIVIAMFFGDALKHLWPLVSILLLGLAWWFFTKPFELTRQAGFILGISAVACAYVGPLFTGGDVSIYFPTLLACLAGGILIKSPLFRIVMASCFFAVLQLSLNSLTLYQVQFPFLEWAFYALINVAFMRGLLLFLWFVKPYKEPSSRGGEKEAGGTMYSGLSSLPEPSTSTTGKDATGSWKKRLLCDEVLMPLRVGIVLSELGYSLYYILYSHFLTNKTKGYLDINYFAFFTGAAFLYALYYTLKKAQVSKMALALALGAGVALSFLSLWAPWLVLGLLAILLARKNGYLPLLAVGISFLVVTTSLHYYQLSIPLLYKSYYLLCAGAILGIMGFTARVITRKAQVSGSLPLPETVFASPILWPEYTDNKSSVSQNWTNPPPLNGIPRRRTGDTNA